MKKIILLFICFITTQVSFGQNAEYSNLVKKADSLYNAKEFKTSALIYSAAFKANSWVGMSDDRYNADCSWALANNSDSFFFNLIGLQRKQTMWIMEI